MRPRVKISALILLCLWLMLALAARRWNSGDVFFHGRTFFVDPDCYSRMTRVAQVYEHPARPVHFHEFENWPEGVRPHTTAPFDYLTAGLALGLRGTVASAQAALDRAGAWISPLLGLLAGVALWARGGRWRYASLALFAVSPILVHGTALGRPDHQSLLILCLAVALAAEWHGEGPGKLSRARAVIGGLAWGLGLWVSLYEPLVMLALFCLVGAAAFRRAFFSRERLVWAAALAAVFVVGLAVDGWNISKPDPVVLAYFTNWSRTVGELGHVTFPEIAAWTGWLLFAAPFILLWRLFRERNAECGFWLGMLLPLIWLTLWQARWGYFLALVFAMALPALFPVSRKGWVACVAWVVFVLSLWPVGREWDQMLDAQQGALAEERRIDNLALYDVAIQLRADRKFSIMAPWWQSPALAYWSGQPCVAGSSHESLLGIVDSARFFACPGLTSEALEILNRRAVGCVVAYDGDRVDEVCGKILGQPAPKESLARRLYEHPHSSLMSEPAERLNVVYSNRSFRIFRYTPPAR